MKKASGRNLLFLVVLFCVALMPLQAISGNIIDTTDYSYWRKLAKTSKMFDAMKTSAISISNQDNSVTRDQIGFVLTFLKEHMKLNYYCFRLHF